VKRRAAPNPFILPTVIVFVFFAIMWCRFGSGFFTDTLWATINDPEWWATNALSFVFFGVFVGWVISRFQASKIRKSREPFEGWTLVIKGFSKDDKPQTIFWSDVEKFESSEFEKWKFVKSAVSNTCRIKTKNLAEAESRWLSLPPNSEEKRIEIDFSKMTKDDVLSWSVQDLPNGWKWEDVTKPPEKDTVRKAVCMKCD